MPPCLSFLFEELASFILEGAFLTVISIVPDAALSADAVIIAVPVDLAVTVPSLPTTAILLLLLVYLILLFEEEPLIDALSLYSSFLPRVIASFDNWTLVVTKLPDGICSTGGSGVLPGMLDGVSVGAGTGASVGTDDGISVGAGSSGAGTLLPSKSVVNAFIHILLYPLE